MSLSVFEEFSLTLRVSLSPGLELRDWHHWLWRTCVIQPRCHFHLLFIMWIGIGQDAGPSALSYAFGRDVTFSFTPVQNKWTVTIISALSWQEWDGRFHWCSQSLRDMGNMYRSVFWADQREVVASFEGRFKEYGFKVILVFEYLIVTDIIWYLYEFLIQLHSLYMSLRE